MSSSLKDQASTDPHGYAAVKIEGNPPERIPYSTQSKLIEIITDVNIMLLSLCDRSCARGGESGL